MLQKCENYDHNLGVTLRQEKLVKLIARGQENNKYILET